MQIFIERGRSALHVREPPLILFFSCLFFHTGARTPTACRIILVPSGQQSLSYGNDQLALSRTKLGVALQKNTTQIAKEMELPRAWCD